MEEIGKALKIYMVCLIALRIAIDVDSLDNILTSREFWEGNKRGDLRKDNGRGMKATKKEANPEWLIMGEAIDIDDGSSEEEDNPQVAENETNDQLCEDSDNGNDTDALVKGLGYSRADFLEKWNNLSKTAHKSVEWRKNHPNVSSYTINFSGYLICSPCSLVLDAKERLANLPILRHFRA